MTEATQGRRALVDLPINTLSTPSKINNAGKITASQKRPIDSVMEPEYPTTLSRAKMSSVRSQRSPRAITRQNDVQPDSLPRIESSSISAVRNAVVDLEEATEEMGEGDSQNSWPSNADFDPDETMASQQTAATEVTQPSRSRASRCAETLRLRLQLAHFKVKTNQINIPLSDLQISSTQSQQSSPIQEPSLPRLLPAPVLRPSVRSPRTARVRIPSSPPCTSGGVTGDNHHDDVLRTPALPRHSTPLRRENGLTDSPGSDVKPRIIEGVLSSSAVRGNAAIGLLGLRQER